MKIKRRAAAVAAAALTAAVIAGCGSSGSPGAAASSAGGTTTTGSDIPVGVIGSYSGTEAAYLQGSDKVAQAWADSVNAAGGINGNKIHLYVEDDNTSQTTAIQEVKTLVQQDHVVAIVGDVSTGDTSWASYVQRMGIPVVGGDSIHTAFLTNPDFYAAGTDLVAGFYGVASLAKTNGPRFGVAYCAELDTCAAVVQLFNALGKPQGVTATYQTKVAATTPDFTALCQSLKNAKVNAYDLALDQATIKRASGQCTTDGVKAPLVTFGDVDSSFLQSPSYNGMQIVDTNYPFFDQSLPAAQQFHAALKKYAPSVGTSATSPLTPVQMQVWTSGKLFEAAVAASGSGPVTAASVKRGLYALKDETLGGLSGPLNFTPGKPSPVNCYFTYKIESGQFVKISGDKPVCAPAALVSTVTAGLG
jgi:branched-chain amino acid transport system substrate-binding protein